MLYQFIVYTDRGAICIEDDSMDGAMESAIASFEYPVTVICVKSVNVYQYPY